MLELVGDRLESEHEWTVVFLNFVAQLVALEGLLGQDRHGHVSEVFVGSEPAQIVGHVLGHADEVG